MRIFFLNDAGIVDIYNGLRKKINFKKFDSQRYLNTLNSSNISKKKFYKRLKLINSIVKKIIYNSLDYTLIIKKGQKTIYLIIPEKTFTGFLQLLNTIVTRYIKQ